MKTTLEIPDDLFRRAKAKAAMDGIKLKDLVSEGLRLRLEIKLPGAKNPSQPLFQQGMKLPLVSNRVSSGLLDITPNRVHQLEMEAAIESYEASLR